MKSAPAIAFDYRPSRLLQAALLLLGIAAIASAWMSALMPALRLATSLLAALVAARALLGLHRSPWRRIAWHADETWTLRHADGSQVLATLSGHSRRGALLILRLQPMAAVGFDAVLLPDNLDRSTFRDLCVRLGRGSAISAALPG